MELNDGKINWISYLYYGGIAIFLSWVTTGCRFGSQVQQSPNPDHFSGYYMIGAESLTFFVTTRSGTTYNTTQKSAPVSLIPTEVSQVLTNPVALLLSDPNSGSANWISPLSTQSTLPVTVNQDSTLSFLGSTSDAPFIQNTDCLSHLEVSETGNLVKTSNLPSLPGNSLPLSGKVQLDIQVITQFQGNCDALFQFIGNCLQEVTACGAQSPTDNTTIQNYLYGFLAPWLQSQAIATSDIPNLVNLAYEVKYE